MIEEDRRRSPEVPGYKHVASDRILSQAPPPLVGRGDALAWLTETTAVVVTRQGSTTVKLPSLKGRVGTCMDASIVNGRPQVVVGFEDGLVATVSGARSAPVLFERPPGARETRKGFRCVMVSWVPGSDCEEVVVVYSDGAIAQFGRSDNDSCTFLESHATTRQMRADEYVVAAAVSPARTLSRDGGCVLALATSKGRLHLVDAGNGSVLGGMSTFFGGFTCVSFSLDGAYVAAGGEDDIVTLWRVGSTGAVHCQGHASWPAACAFEGGSQSPDVRLWSVGHDGKVCVFEVQEEDFPAGGEGRGDADAWKRGGSGHFVPMCKSKRDLCPVAPLHCFKLVSEPLRAIGLAAGGLMAIATKRTVMQFSALPSARSPKDVAPLPVESARLFQKQWHVYRTVLQNNDLCHMDTIESISRDFARSADAPSGAVASGRRRVLDIGCGDGAVMSAVLKNLEKSHPSLKLARYTGVDASRSALDLNVVPADDKTLQEMELQQYLAVCKRGEYDAILANLILHHFDEDGKRRLVRQIAGLLADNGVFYWGDVYDTHPGEGRAALLDRWKARMGQYKGLSSEELVSVWEHVSEKDFPSSMASMRGAMEGAGLSVEVLHDDEFYFVLLKGTKCV